VSAPPPSHRALAPWIIVLGILPLPAAGSDLLDRGNEAFRAGKFEEAAAIYETSEPTPDALLRRFNAGVSWSRAGKPEKAMERFEEVSARAEGKLRRDALYNAAHASFLKGKGLFDGALKRETDEEKLAGLAEAGRSYRTSVDLFGKVEPPDDDTQHNLAVARTALRTCLDQAIRIEEEKKRKAEEKALEEPAELLRSIAAKERLHRALARSLAEEAGSKRRLGSRRLRKSEMENRGLAEKLHHYLTAPPPDPGPVPPGAPAGAGQQPAGGGMSDEEKAARARAGEALSRAIAAQKDAEIAYSKLEVAAAPAAHTKAIEELRAAREAFPVNLPAIIGEAIATQEKVNEVLEGFLGEKDAGSAGGGLPGAAIEALKDNVLAPVAKFLRPKTDERIRPLADEEDEVVWSSRILSQANVPPGPAAQPGPDGAPTPAPGQGGPPPLDEESAKKLSEGLQREGQTALAASTKAREELAKGAAEPALSPGKEALEALRRAADLIPKPPETPEERLKKLIEKQRAAAPAAENLSQLEPDARAPASAELAESQRGDGREAGGIASELEKRQDDPARKAAPKVREGEGEVFASAEALGKARSEEAKLSIERGVKAFEEALALLQGKDPQSGDQKQDQQQGGDQDQEQPKDEKGKDKKDKGKDEKEKKDKSHYAVTPRDARLLREEMDRKRRDEESKLFIAPSGIAVEKDW